MNMIGPTELIIILVIVLIIFGAGRLPQVFESFGKGIKAFRDAQKDDSIDVSSSAPSNKQLDHDPISEAQELREHEKTKQTG
ncbi:MAG: twin-arginine translocase TatA/TatE family subunit [Alphaproteobacteria bacterium]|nr:twin-arginine translocase TatA/TatE family subunit [Alphaproteobacteria bacterium]